MTLPSRMVFLEGGLGETSFFYEKEVSPNKGFFSYV